MVAPPDREPPQIATSRLPVLAVRNAVLFPGVALPITIVREASRRAIESARDSYDSRVVVVLQHSSAEEPSFEDLHPTGVVARFGHAERHPRGLQVTLLGEHRVVLEAAPAESSTDDTAANLLFASAAPAPEVHGASTDAEGTMEVQALVAEVRDRATELTRIDHRAEELSQVVQEELDPGRLADLVASVTEMPLAERQALLDSLDARERLRGVLLHVERRLAILGARLRIRSAVHEDLDERRRRHLLREELRGIRRELGEGDDDAAALRARFETVPISQEVRDEIERELSRYERLGAESSEGQVIRDRIEWIADLPWERTEEEPVDLDAARGVLSSAHYGLEEVKDRVLEVLAVHRLRQERGSGDGQDNGQRGEHATEPVLLLSGPPGVGKTSVVRSIARAMGRPYVRVALGGVRDASDIRGHRRSYVGASCGRILSGMRDAGAANPVMLLDEIDKMGASRSGDPAAALLEVLDPGQNRHFVDHYLGVPFDLSQVLFVATANVVGAIPGPLRDRLEIVPFVSYTEDEKVEIALRHLVPRQIRSASLHPEEFELERDAIVELVRHYTYEAGVRGLGQQIARLARKTAVLVGTGESPDPIGAATVREMLGRSRVRIGKALETDEVGVATGMFFTEAGGDILFVEVTSTHGSGQLTLTGKLGDVMQESAQAAWSCARAAAERLGIMRDISNRDLHVHAPAGAMPKDGPSAGITIATAMVSRLTGQPVRADTAMTGEVTLTGRVLPVGGIRDKLIGAARAGIKRCIVPADNQADIDELPQAVRDALEIIPLEDLEDVIRSALAP